MSISPLEITRRTALGTMAAAGLGFALLGPRGRPEDAGDRLVLQYWEKWTGVEAQAMQQIVDAFNASQDRLYVRYFSMSSIDQKAMVAIAGGRPPDIVGLWNFNIPAYAESGAIIPLDELADHWNIRQEAYVDALWPLLRHEDRLYGIVSTCGSIALYYNRALFGEVGLDPDRPPRTIAELDEAHERLTRIRKADSRIERVGFLHTEPGWWMWHWGKFFGGDLYDEARDLCTADEPGNVAGLAWAQRYARSLGPSAIANFQSGLGTYFSAQNAFLSGRVAMLNQGPWISNVIDALAPDLDYGVAPFPVEASLDDPTRPIGLLDADVLVIPAGAKHPEASMEFIAYTQRPENIELVSVAHGKNAPLKAMPERFYARHRHRALHIHDAIANSPRAFQFPRTRVWPEYLDTMKRAFDACWSDPSRSPADELAQVRRVVQAKLDRASQRRELRRALG